MYYDMDKDHVIELFVGIIHVNNISALSLKEAIDGFFSSTWVKYC